MKKLLFTLFAYIGINTAIYAQYVDNALLFSQLNYSSTARSTAMGNAFGAIGGEFGALSINPAGVAIYLQDAISATIGLINLNSIETSYQGNKSKEKNYNFNLNNFGLVFSIPSQNNFSNLVSYNFAIGYNRLADLHEKTFVSTGSSPYSRMDDFVQKTNGINYNLLMKSEDYGNDPYQGNVPWESNLAWATYLIDVTNPDSGGDNYSTFLLENEKVKQQEKASYGGAINEYLATFGINFGHKVYLGGTFCLQNLIYEVTKTYTENGIDEVNSNLKSWGQFDYSSYSKTTGLGINCKFGIIYRPLTTLRIGFAIHTPTYFSNKVTYSSVMYSNLTDISSVADGMHTEKSPVGNYEYRFRTPLRIIAGMVYQIARKGMVSVDYEIVDYSSSKYSHGLGGETFTEENEDIKNVYKTVGNIRLGTEFRVTNTLILRGGIQRPGNPYKSESNGVTQPNKDYKFTIYNCGIGYRKNNYTFDLAYSLGNKTSYNYLYKSAGIDVNPVKFQSFTNEFMFSFSLKI